MATQDNLKTARDAFEAWNKHDLERHAKLLDEKHVFESDTIPAPMVGRDAGRQFMAVYLTGFPDLHLEVNQELAVGDLLVDLPMADRAATGTSHGSNPVKS